MLMGYSIEKLVRGVNWGYGISRCKGIEEIANSICSG